MFAAAGPGAPPIGYNHASRLPDGWWPVALLSDLADKPVARRLGGLRLALFRDASGEPRAVEDVCPHRRLPLTMGWRTAEGHIQCAYHGWVFEGAGGACVAIPNLEAGEALPPAHRVAAFPTAVVDGLILVRTGDGDAAPPAGSGPEWRPLRSVEIPVRAPWERVSEALLWNPGRSLGLHRLLGADAEVSGAGVETEAGLVRARRERTSFAFPRRETYRPMFQRSASAAIASAVATGWTEIVALGVDGEPRARILAAATPVSDYRTMLRLQFSRRAQRGPGLFAGLAPPSAHLLVRRVEAAADAVEDVLDPALQRLRRARAELSGGRS